MRLTEDLIVSYFQSGKKKEALDSLINSHGRSIYNIALFMVNETSAAEDITHDVFLRIFKGLSRFKGEAKLSTWIYRITHNVCYDYLKRKKKWKHEDLEILDGKKADFFNPDPQDSYFKEWTQKTVRSAVQELPESQRMAITLHYFHSLRYEDIANIMNVSIGTVKSNIHRGKQHLKQTLNPILGV